MISFDRKKTMAALTPLISKIVTSKSPYPICEFVLIEVRKGEDLMYLTCTDCNLSGTARVTLSQCAGEDFKVCVQARLLQDMLKSLPDGEVTLSVKDGTAFLRWNSGESILSTAEPADFPNTYAITEPVIQGRMKRSSLATSLRTVIKAAAEESFGRPALASVLFDSLSGSLNLVASDSQQLICASFPSELPDGNFLLPNPGAGLLNVILAATESDVVDVVCSKSHARFDMDDFSFTSTLVAAKFPKYQGVIPQGPPGILLIDRQRLVQIIKRASIFCSKETGCISLSFSPGNLKIASEDLGYGMNLKESADCEYSGPEINMKVKAGLLVDILHSIPGERIEIGITESIRPLRFRPETPETEGETQLAVLMPAK
jgi:DNA polymerase-3 subunit beta